MSVGSLVHLMPALGHSTLRNGKVKVFRWQLFCSSQPEGAYICVSGLWGPSGKELPSSLWSYATSTPHEDLSMLQANKEVIGTHASQT